MGEQEKKFKVTGMKCAGCAQEVEETLKELSGISYAKVDLGNESVCIIYNSNSTDFSSMKKALKEKSFELLD